MPHPKNLWFLQSMQVHIYEPEGHIQPSKAILSQFGFYGDNTDSWMQEELPNLSLTDRVYRTSQARAITVFGSPLKALSLMTFRRPIWNTDTTIPKTQWIMIQEKSQALTWRCVTRIVPKAWGMPGLIFNPLVNLWQGWPMERQWWSGWYSLCTTHWVGLQRKWDRARQNVL